MTKILQEYNLLQLKLTALLIKIDFLALETDDTKLLQNS